MLSTLLEKTSKQSLKKIINTNSNIDTQYHQWHPNVILSNFTVTEEKVMSSQTAATAVVLPPQPKASHQTQLLVLCHIGLFCDDEFFSFKKENTIISICAESARGIFIHSTPCWDLA